MRQTAAPVGRQREPPGTQVSTAASAPARESRAGTRRVLVSLVAVLAVLVLAGWALGALVIPLTGGVDAAALHALRSHEDGHLITAMEVVTRLGSGLTVSAIGVPVAAVLLWRGRSLDALLPVLSTLGAMLLVQTVKLLVSRPRPTDPLIHTGTASFPSGHSGNAVAFYGSLALLVVISTRRRGMRAAAVVSACVIILAVGFSRLALGVHYPSDVLAGYLLCGLWVGAVLTAYRAVSRGSSAEAAAAAVEPAPPAPRRAPPRSGTTSPQASRYGWRAVDPPHRPVLFVNPRSGGGKAAAAAVADRARDRGIETIVLTPDHDLATLARDAVDGGADALGMAGGDGSLAVVAAAACKAGLPFICIPAGTRNHFACDVGVDRRDLIGSLDAFTEGTERRIDAADVNGRIFLNNVSIGIYGDAVQRPAYRDAKLRTLLQTAEEVLTSSASAPALHLIDDRGREHRDPAVVLVSNNPYALDRPPALGTRPALSSGRLGIVVLNRPGGIAAPPGRAWSAPSLTVTAESAVHAGIDGEAVELEPALLFTLQPSALRVRISARHPGASPSGWAPPGSLGAPAPAAAVQRSGHERRQGRAHD